MLAWLEKNTEKLCQENSAYASLTGRIRCMETSLFSKKELNDLLAQNDLNKFAYILDEKSYPEASSLLERVEKERIFSDAFIRSQIPCPLAAEIIFLYQLYHNLKTMFKLCLPAADEYSKLNNEINIPTRILAQLYPMQKQAEFKLIQEKSFPRSDIVKDDEDLTKLWNLCKEVMQEGEKDIIVNLSEALLQHPQNIDPLNCDIKSLRGILVSEMADLNNFSFDISEITGITKTELISPFIKSVLQNIRLDYIENSNMAMLDACFDVYYYLHLSILAIHSQDSYLLAYSSLKSDLANANILHRLLKLNIADERAFKYWCPGGSISYEEFVECLHTKKDLVSETLSTSFTETKKIVKSFASVIDEYLLKFASLSKKTIYGLPVVLGYWIFKQSEAQNLRILISMLQQDMTKDEIAALLREGYLDV